MIGAVIGGAVSRAALVAIALLGAQAHAEDATPRLRMLGPTAAGDFSGPMLTMADLKFAGMVKQRYDFSCGSAALATLLESYGDRHGEAATFKGMWAGGDHARIRKLGFSMLDMKRYLATRNLVANGYKVSLAAVEKAGSPGIALISVKGYRHFVVVQGVRDGEVLIADPALGRRVETVIKFEKMWNGILFAIDTGTSASHGGFNNSTQWAAYNRAPVGSRFADPLSLQALTLTSPFYRDY